MVSAYEETRNLSVILEGEEELIIEAKSGYLQIQQVDDTDQITVEAVIRVDTGEKRAREIIEKKLKLSLEKRKNRIYLYSYFHSDFFGDSIKKGIDLFVKLPAIKRVDITAGSGAISIDGLDTDLNLVDGSGKIEIRDCSGEWNIKDGSGKIEISDCSGDWIIDDGSGDIMINNMEGSLVLNDTSGGIDIYNFYGFIQLQDGSGPINLDGIEGDVVILEAGSGSLSLKNINGNVEK
jgi:DUF4097 and DUF4098 domain-containing protein YvlB